MDTEGIDLAIETLGPCRVPSPLPHEFWVPEGEQVVYETSPERLAQQIQAGRPIPALDKAGPRERLFFDPAKVGAGIVTCGGLCPGLNDVIRALVIGLSRSYGVQRILGFKYGYEGLVDRIGHVPIELTTEFVDDIHQHGGTILGSSRGPQEPAEMVDCLVARGIDLLFTIGGDGTQRGAQAIADEVKRRGLPIAVVGVPKTIDNDLVVIERSFGFATAVEQARTAIMAAHTESKDAPHGIGIVKLMGRESGFIAAYSAMANSEVDVCLIPEVPVVLEGEYGLLAFLGRRLAARRHAVVIVAEGACQDLIAGPRGTDKSGNQELKDVGLFLKSAIAAHFQGVGLPVSIKYIDPSYTIRSVPANAEDSVYCLQLGHHAVHAAMAGKTALIVGSWANEFVHVPMGAIVGRRRKIDPDGIFWETAIQALGQPQRFGVPSGYRRMTRGMPAMDGAKRAR